MIDFHSHILPAIDDGSFSLEETQEMLRMEEQQGVRKIIATPHFYADQKSVGDFLTKRQEALRQVRELAREHTWVPDILAGSEVYYFPGMGRAEMLSQMCIEGTSLLLVEMPFAQWTKDMLKELHNIIEKQKLTIILAHVERYYEFQRKKEIWNQILELPLYIQVNAGALQSRKKKSCIFKLIKNGLSVIIGSDCHNTTSRPPNLEQGCEILSKKFGDSVIQRIDDLGKRILEEYDAK